jgi:cyclopropane fatty-acyl-phospholipid synthase-like methyltransferase
MAAVTEMTMEEKRRLQAVTRARVVQPVLRALDLDPSARVLDLGCGRGSWTLELALRGHRVVAVDQRSEALEWVCLEAARLSLPVECIEADFRTHVFESRFDLVVQIFTGVTSTGHLARFVSKNGLVLWQQDWEARHTDLEGFEVCKTFAARPGLRVLRRCR